MSGNKKPESAQPKNVASIHAGQREFGMLSDKPYMNNPPIQSNLAVKRSLIEIFDEFTQVISGELKSMNLEQFEAEQNKRKS